MVKPFSGWAIIRLSLEYRRKLIYCNVDIKSGETRSRFTMFGWECGYVYKHDVDCAVFKTVFVVSSVSTW
jgi:hypothetical protein